MGLVLVMGWKTVSMLWYVPTNTLPELWSCVMSVITACQGMPALPRASHSTQILIVTLLESQTQKARNEGGNCEVMKMRGLYEAWFREWGGRGRARESHMSGCGKYW